MPAYMLVFALCLRDGSDVFGRHRGGLRSLDNFDPRERMSRTLVTVVWLVWIPFRGHSLVRPHHTDGATTKRKMWVCPLVCEK